MAKVHVKKGDRVYVLTGEERGKSGKILRVLPKKNRVIIDGINMMKKHYPYKYPRWHYREPRSHGCL